MKDTGLIKRSAFNHKKQPTHAAAQPRRPRVALRKTVAIIGALTSALLCAMNYTAPMRTLRALPEKVCVSDQSGQVQTKLPRALAPWLVTGPETVTVTASQDARLQGKTQNRTTYRLFGLLPLKSVETVQSADVYLVPGGTAVGITIRTRGVLVVGLGAVDTTSGVLSPGTAAGIQAGDVIVSADGQPVLNADHLAKLVQDSTGEMTLSLMRKGTPVETALRLVRDATNSYRIGLWVRDSTAGVGTLSFVDAQTGWYAALGHPVSDIDTQSLLTVREGRIMPTQIVDIKKGEQGMPGELIGEFSVSGKGMGDILVNTEFGIYGRLAHAYENPLYEKLPMARGFEARTGSAELIATISGDGVQAFNCEVIRVNAQSEAATKGMVVEVTDERLLAATGGIVQGMSGCPIVQDGKLIGVVTHVFVNDPTRGYCVYAEWMREQIVEANAA